MRDREREEGAGEDLLRLETRDLSYWRTPQGRQGKSPSDSVMKTILGSAGGSCPPPLWVDVRCFIGATWQVPLLSHLVGLARMNGEPPALCTFRVSCLEEWLLTTGHFTRLQFFALTGALTLKRFVSRCLAHGVQP